MNINTVIVIGVIDTNSTDIAGVFASFGNAKVYCMLAQVLMM